MIVVPSPDRRGPIDGGHRGGRRSSPHVGWFRHAPPTTSTAGMIPPPSSASVAGGNKPRRISFGSLDEARSMLRPPTASGTCGTYAPSSSSSSLPRKSSPYIGWFRHAPPSYSASGQNSSKRRALRDDRPGSSSCNKCPKTSPSPMAASAFAVDGRLPGGRPLDGDNEHAGPPSDAPGGGSFPPISWLDHQASSTLPRPSAVPYHCHPGLERRFFGGGGVQDLRDNFREAHAAAHQEDDAVSCCSSSCPSTAFAAGGNGSGSGSEAGRPSATVGLLDRLAHWFLFAPGAASASSGYSDPTRMLATFVFPFLTSLLRNVLLLEDGRKRSSHDIYAHGQQGSDEDGSDSASDYDSDDEDGEMFPRSSADYYVGREDESSSSSSERRSRGGNDDAMESSSSRHRLDVSISSLAERYYAHEARKELLEELQSSGMLGGALPSSPSSSSYAAYGVTAGGIMEAHPSSNQQLDYVITQIDIARMVRNASRHLDVESILSLPTVTYRAKTKTNTEEEEGSKSTKEEEARGGGSQMIVDGQQGDDDRRGGGGGSSLPREGEEGPNGEGVGSEHDRGEGRQQPDEDFAGWSWMIVPSPDGPPSGEGGIAEGEEEVAAERDDDRQDDDSEVRRSAQGDIVVEQDNDDKEDDEEEEEDKCVICLEHFADGDRLRVLPCAHLFHVGCIDRWLSGSYSDEECYTSGCPSCREHPVRCREEEELGVAVGGGLLRQSMSGGGRRRGRGRGGGAGAEEEEEMSAPPSPDGSVPSWAFTRLGDAMASSGSTISR